MRNTVLAMALVAGLASVSEAQFKWIGCSGAVCPKDSMKAPATREPALAPVREPAAPAVPDSSITASTDANVSGSSTTGGASRRPSGISTRRQTGAPMNDRFLTSQACLTALASGSARYYQPTFFKPKSLARGERVLPLEHDACVRMQIVGSIAWVPQARGTEFVFRGTTPIRRRDCGNAVYGIVYPPTPVARLTPTRKDTVYIDSTIVVRRDLVEERIVEEQAPPLVVKSGFPWWRTLGAAALVSAGACAVASDRFGDKWYKFNCFPGDRVEVDVTQVVQALRAFRRQ